MVGGIIKLLEQRESMNSLQMVHNGMILMVMDMVTTNMARKETTSLTTRKDGKILIVMESQTKMMPSQMTQPNLRIVIMIHMVIIRVGISLMHSLTILMNGWIVIMMV